MGELSIHRWKGFELYPVINKKTVRIAIGLAWLAIIAAEIVMSGVVGIGFFIWDAFQQNYVSEVILAVIYIGAVGLLLDRLVAWVQRRIVPEQ